MNIHTFNIWLIESLKGTAGTFPFEPGGAKLLLARVYLL